MITPSTRWGWWPATTNAFSRKSSWMGQTIRDNSTTTIVPNWLFPRLAGSYSAAQMTRTVILEPSSATSSPTPSICRNSRPTTIWELKKLQWRLMTSTWFRRVGTGAWWCSKSGIRKPVLTRSRKFCQFPTRSWSRKTTWMALRLTSTPWSKRETNWKMLAPLGPWRMTIWNSWKTNTVQMNPRLSRNITPSSRREICSGKSSMKR